MNVMKRILLARVPAIFSSWLRNTRASVSVEFVGGAVLFLTITVGTLDVYRLMDTSSLGAGAATAMVDYVSLEPAPQAAHLSDLAKFVNWKQIAVPSHAAFVISAFVQPAGAGATPTKQWKHEILVPPENETALTLAEICGASRTLIGTGGAFPSVFTTDMKAGEEFIVVEACVKVLPAAMLSGGLVDAAGFPSELYQYRIVPVRDAMPAEPS